MASELVQKALAVHNDYRGQHGSSPLEWCEELEKGALLNAQAILTDPHTQLSFPEGAPESAKLGYNVFQYEGQGQGQLSDEEVVQEAVNSWYKSLANVESANEDPSKGGNFLSKSTQRVGLGVARREGDVEVGGASAIVVFAFYDPPGHFRGQEDDAAIENSENVASTETAENSVQSEEKNETTTTPTVIEETKILTTESAQLDVIIDPSVDSNEKSTEEPTTVTSTDGATMEGHEESVANETNLADESIVAIENEQNSTTTTVTSSNEITEEKVETIERTVEESDPEKTTTTTTTTIDGQTTAIEDIAAVISTMLKEAEGENLKSAEKNQTTTITATIKGPSSSDETTEFESALRNALTSSGVMDVKISTGSDLISTVEVTAAVAAAAVAAPANQNEGTEPSLDQNEKSQQPENEPILLETAIDLPANNENQEASDLVTQELDEVPLTDNKQDEEGMDLILTEEELIDVEAIPIIVQEVLKKTQENLAKPPDAAAPADDAAADIAQDTAESSNSVPELATLTTKRQQAEAEAAAVDTTTPEQQKVEEEPKLSSQDDPETTKMEEVVATATAEESQKFSEEISTASAGQSDLTAASEPVTQENEVAAETAPPEMVADVEPNLTDSTPQEESQPACAEVVTEAPVEISAAPPMPDPTATVLTKGMLENLAQVLNEYRRKHGAPSLKIEPKLTDEAKNYAISILKDTPDEALIEKLDVGKNVFHFEGSAAASDDLVAVFRTAVESWYSTVEGFVWASPITSTPESHTFCQLVWASSRKFSIGVAAQEGSKGVIVVLYAPGANFSAEKNFRANVRPDFS